MTTESDRELLELAAKAAGYDLQFATGPSIKPQPWIKGKHRDVYWNPLTDDGDALRLAVKLCIDIKPPRSEDDNAQARQIEQSFGVFEAQRGADPYAATRKAITRAAATIGAHKEGD